MAHKFDNTRFKALPVVGILRGFDTALVLEIAEQSLKAGLTTFEITMNTRDAAAQLREVCSAFGEKLNIGAGTVTDLARLDAALDAGASFIVTPTFEPDVVQTCVELGIPVFPGAFTPTEVLRAWEAGATMVKLFPANLHGPDYLKTLKAPLDEVRLMPVGGVSPDNVPAYRAAGAEGYGVGTPLFDRKRMDARDWEWFASQVSKFKEALA